MTVPVHFRRSLDRLRYVIALTCLILLSASMGAPLGMMPSEEDGQSDLLASLVHGVMAAGLAAASLLLGLSTATGSPPSRLLRGHRRVSAMWMSCALLFLFCFAVGLAWPLDIEAVLAMVEQSPVYDKVVDESGGVASFSSFYIFLNNFGITTLVYFLPGMVLYFKARVLVYLFGGERPGRVLAASVRLLGAAALITPLLSMVVNGYLVGSVLQGKPEVGLVRMLVLIIPHGVLELPGVFLLAATAITLWRTLFPALTRPPERRLGGKDVMVHLLPPCLLALLLVSTAAIVEVEATLSLFFLTG